VFKVDALHQQNCSIDDRFRGEAMNVVVLKAKYIAKKMKRTDLTSTI
jgi:hypothetical protein